MKKYQNRISDALAASGTTLMQSQGISTRLAAKILGETAGVSRFPTAAHFAGYAGVSPLDASSGENQRQRLNTGGNRQLNAILHIMAVCQVQHGSPGRDYYARKISEGKSPREARRALKRRLCNLIYPMMIKVAPIHNLRLLTRPGASGERARDASPCRWAAGDVAGVVGL